MAEILARLRESWGAKGFELSATEFLVLLAISAAAAMVVALLYVRFYGQRASGSEIHRAFPLLGIAITAIFVCIQFSLPLSLGLLGALSIVRFRTPIKEPEEIGFLMVVIATSLACATGKLAFLAVLVVAALGTLLAKELARPIFRRRKEAGLVVVTLSEADYAVKQAALFEVLGGASRRGGLESLTVQEGQVTVTYAFAGLPAAAAPALERRLAERVGPASTSIVYATAGVP